MSSEEITTLDEPAFEKERQRRIDLLESAAGAQYLADDLALVDVVVAIAVLIAVTAGLLWWAY